MIQAITTNAQQVFKRELLLMGSAFEFTIVGNDSADVHRNFKKAIDEVKRIEGMISSWDDNSQTSNINNNAGLSPVKVSHELFQLITRCIKISELTDGAFDITYASMDKIWKFDGSMEKMPSDDEIQRSIRKVGYQKIQMNAEDTTVYLTEKGMKIGFGAIGKGYAADKVSSLLKAEGVESGIVNAGGDLTAWGKQPNDKEWLVAIVNPEKKGEIFSWMPVDNASVVTSGNYEKFVTFNGINYTHIIDPRSGIPAHGIKSTTIFTASAELADGLATAVFVMGTEAGLNLINQLKGVECVIIDEENKLIHSENINIEKSNNKQ